MIKSQASEAKKIYEMINRGEYFALARFADGERLFIEGKSARGIDGWTSPNGKSKLGLNLESALEEASTNGCLIGISDDDTDLNSKMFYANRIWKARAEQVTFSNIFVNSTYPYFRDVIVPAIANSDRKVVLVCSQDSNLEVIMSHYPDWDVMYGPKDCSSFWDRSGDKWLKRMDELALAYNNTYFLFALGPISSVSVPRMWSLSQSNTYIDIGSALDPVIKGFPTRPYHLPGSPDSLLSSTLIVQDDITSFKPRSVACILNCYKRYDSLDKWLSAITNQSISVDEVHILFNTLPPSDVLESLRTKTEVTNILVSDLNLGVWNRFAYAFNLKSEYVCIFDDDTIPGTKWIENCLTCMDEEECVLGTVGLRLHSHDTYMNHTRYGWPSQNNEKVEVDLVGHSWFFKKEWLSSYWRDQPPVSGFDFMGEDMHLSYATQKYLNIKTYVPPHPKDDKQLWGSLNSERGIDADAISMSGKATRMNLAVNRLLGLGWKLIDA